MLSGYPQPPEEPIAACEENCELIVTLPADAAQPPTVSEKKFHVKQGVQVQIVLQDEGDRPGQAATLLHFPGESPFFNPGGQPMPRVRLDRPGKQMVTVRDDGVCGPPDGCKYDVDNHGNNYRDILDPHVIVWD